jgi:dienelactone hydrolase
VVSPLFPLVAFTGVTSKAKALRRLKSPPSFTGYHRLMWLRFVGVLLVAAVRAQTISVVPERALVDVQAAVHVSGVAPGERVTIRAELTDGDGLKWSSEAEFVADAEGCLDTSKTAAVAGSYKDVSAMGLVWAMKAEKNVRYQTPARFGEQTIDFKLLRAKQEIGAAKLVQSPIAEGVEQVQLHDGRLRGVLFVAEGAKRGPGVLVLGGSEGGMPRRKAAWLASHGFTALALAYFRFDDLPKDLAGIPLEYFGEALNWMAKRPEIAGDKIAVVGTSRGGELALQIASMYRVKAVVAYAPADMRYPACCGFTPVPFAWTWKGQGLAYHRVRGGSASDDLHAAIPVENIEGPVMVISGGEDKVWSSSGMASSVVDRLKRHHFAFDAEQLNYPHAGHAAGRPEIVPAWDGFALNPTSMRETQMGGSAKGNAESTLDAVPKVIEFLRKAIGG